MRFRATAACFKACALALALAVCASGQARPPGAPPPMPQAAAAPYLDPAEFEPARLVAAPPPTGSAFEALELARLRALIAATSSERLEQARRDGDREDPGVFSAVIGHDLGALPATWALLTLVQAQTDEVIERGKTYFARKRPYAVDPELPACVSDPLSKPARSFPSGHSGMGYAVGWVLAKLLPDKAPQILARADDYALSREICGVHFHSDTEASHVIGTLIAATLLADPRLSGRITAARAELGGR